MFLDTSSSTFSNDEKNGLVQLVDGIRYICERSTSHNLNSVIQLYTCLLKSLLTTVDPVRMKEEGAIREAEVVPVVEEKGNT